MVTLVGSNGTYSFDPQDPANRIGQGGMGVVFRGQEVSTGQTVAIKILYRELTAQASHVERARREAAIQIKHDNLLEMLDFVELKGIYHSVSEFLEGQSLNRKLDALRASGEYLSPPEVLSILGAVLNGLELLHQHQPRVIHRDVDPSNIMLCHDGRVKLMDFGVVKMSDGTRKSLTGIGAIIGKPHYSAPEQIRNRPGDVVDESTDLYALGITAYELLTGQVPFDAPNEYDLMQMQVQQPLPRHPRLSAAQYQFLATATAKDQRQRYRNATQMRAALLALAEAGKTAPPPRPVLWKQRPVQVAALTLPVLAVLGGYFYRNNQQKLAQYELLSQKAEVARSREYFDSAAVAYNAALALFSPDSLQTRKKLMDDLPVSFGLYARREYNSAYRHFAEDTLDASAREAFYYLGEMTLRGQGVEPNRGRALGLLQRAARMNFARAQYALGSYYADENLGLGIVKKDLAQARYWLSQAQQNGHPNAATALANVARLEQNPERAVAFVPAFGTTPAKKSTKPKRKRKPGAELDDFFRNVFRSRSRR